MFLELNILDQTKSEIAMFEECFSAIKFGAKTIFTSSYYASKIQSIVPKEIKIACPIDYPNGLGDTSLRQHECISAIHHGANYIDIVINPILLINKQRNKLKEDIKANLSICKDNNVEFRAIMDYRMYPERLIYITCELLSNLGIQTIIPSTGQFAEDYIDNLIICEIIQNKFPSIKTIFNGYFLNQDQYDKIKKSKISTVRLKSFNGLIK